MNNIQTDIILEFQKSIDKMTRFGQEMESLDARFGRLDQRIDAMRNSFSSLNNEVSRGTGSNLRRQLETEMNNLIQGNGVVLGQVGNAPFKVSRETVRGVFKKVETELNAELQKFVRNMNIDIDPNYAKGERLPVGNEDFDAINKEVAKVIRLQIANLISFIQQHKANLMKPDNLEGLQISVGKSTVLALVNKIKDEVIRKIENPNIADLGELKITRTDLNKVVNQVNAKLNAAFDVDVADVKSLNVKDIDPKVRRIPEEIEKGVNEYVNKTVTGINGAMKGKIEIPLGDLSNKMKRIIAKELRVSDDQLTNLRNIPLGSIGGYELKTQLERVSKALDKKMSTSVQEEIDGVIKAINDAEILPSPKLKRHLVNQINRINNKLIDKIRQQVDVQVDSMIREINESQSRPRSLNRDTSNLNSTGGRDRVSGDNSSTAGQSGQNPSANAGDPSARADAKFNDFGLGAAITNTFRNVLSGNIKDTSMMFIEEAVKTFINVQSEQIKMLQNFSLKGEYLNDPSDPKSGTNMGAVENVVDDLQSFIRQQATFYGTDYNQLYQVGGTASRLLEKPEEVKKFVQLTAQLNTVAPGSDPIKIANGLESIKAQFGLELADMTEKVAQPLVAVSSLTNTSIESILDAVKRTGSTANTANKDPLTSIVLAGMSKQASALGRADIGNFYNSVINRAQSTKTLSDMTEVSVDPYYRADDKDIAMRMQSPEATAKIKELLGDGYDTMTDETGTKISRSFDQILQDIAKKLVTADDNTRRNTYDAMFGTYQSSKGSATMHEILDTFVNVYAGTSNFNPENYQKMILESLDNPLVNANRAKQSVTVALDSLTQELTPAFNKASYAIMSFANGVEKHAAILADLGGVFATILTGFLTMRGLKFIGNKTGANIVENTNIERMRTGFLGSLSNMRGDKLLSDEFKNLSRKDIGRMQQNPQLEPYIREMHTMTDEQKNHFKNYVRTNRIDVKDIPTLFTAMDEAKIWDKPKNLNNNERYERFRQYNNRLSTRPELSNILSPDLLNTLNNSTANMDSYNNHVRSVDKYENLSNRMTRMSQKEFIGFEDSLVERQRNGLPPIRNIKSLNNALKDYEKTQDDDASAARRSSPVFGSLSDAVRSLNSDVSRTGGMRKEFNNFLRGIPTLARGAGVSLLNLGKSIGKLGLEMAAMYVVGKAMQGISEGMTMTEDQRMLAEADGREQQNTFLANTLKNMEDGAGAALLNPAMYGGVIRGMLGSVGNGIKEFFGGVGDDVGYFKTLDDLGAMKSFYGFNGSNADFAVYLKDQKGMTMEQAVNQWYQEGGEGKRNEKLRQDAMIVQYEQNMMKQAEEERLKEIADENYAKKYEEGLLYFPSVNKDDVNKRISDGLENVNNDNALETIQSLKNGMRTDSDEYIKMRKRQVQAQREIVNAELGIIDDYILKAKNILDSADPDSQEYKNAEEEMKRMQKVRDEMKKQNEQQLLQEEYNNYLESYQSQVGSSDRRMQKIDLVAQAKELAATYSMDTQSQGYYDAMKNITKNKVAQMKAELENLKSIQAKGDQTEELALKIMQTQNNIASEQANLKQLSIDALGIGRQDLEKHNSQRENELLALQVDTGITDNSSPLIRNKRIANYKSEVSEITSLIDVLRGQLKTAETPDKVTAINEQIRDLTKQSLQAQLGILEEMKSSAGTFNMPKGVTAMSRYEYLTRGNTHNTTTIGNGDVTVNITLPNITNGATPSQLQAMGQALGQGFASGRVGSLRMQQAMNPGNYRS